jgi:hypothetical protein
MVDCMFEQVWFVWTVFLTWVTSSKRVSNLDEF